MIKITDKNRSGIILGGILLIGILLIGFVMYFENDEVESMNKVNDPAPTNVKALESLISNLKTQKFDASNYASIASEINGSHTEGLITGSAKNNLLNNLNTAYADLVYAKCEGYLNTNSNHTSGDIFKWLTQLENIISKNRRIEYYRGQIKAYDHYAVSLPNKINNFCRLGNFDEEKYLKLKNEMNEMSSLDNKYKSKSKFINIKLENINMLENAYRDWIEIDSDF
ncbi:hypothetical protein FLGE108171_14620 [Flavobacterium gelidilacus]|uniref:hypothetical protein n=1 Tax=Flavobacterium gelidilacus TaxID=206041 RepID=UPI00042589C2|nr:hypothetical protein [Flavobacterium gelidilacus]